MSELDTSYSTNTRKFLLCHDNAGYYIIEDIQLLCISPVTMPS